MSNPNEEFKDLLSDLERLRNSPPSKPMDQTLAKSRPITSRQRKSAIALKRLDDTQPVKQSKRSIMVFIKKPAPLAKAVPVATPRFVWTGHAPKIQIPAGVVIEGFKQ